MSNGDLFYVCGAALAVSAVAVSFIGLRVKSFPGRAAPLVALWFVALVGASTTFAILHAKDEQDAKAAELSEAGEEAERAESGAPVEAEEKEEAPKPNTQGAATTLQLSASPTQIAFDTTKLSAQAGKITIDFNNPSALEHDVAIEQNGKQIAISETIAKSKTSVSADLEPGTYTFLCTVPGHAEAGMEGTLTVQ
ncbi:MAG TPA: plastocyanin/azurin family copper-binding protein [Solirubrobacterales bacterium]|nr:plastocyanin/azurin family copper-binding protein [Solirubrobacterales bacterium]